jgi:Tfp pilus assembly protein PilN
MTQPDELSFLPDGYQHRRSRRRTMVAGVTGLVVVVSVIATAIVVAERSLRQVEQQDAEVSRTFDDATQRVESFRQQRQEQLAFVQRAELAAALTGGVPRSNILAELTNALPSGASLLEVSLEPRMRQEAASAGSTAFEMKKAALQARRASENPGLADLAAHEDMLKVSGLAQTDAQVSQYLTQLSHSKLFRDVSLLISETQAASGQAGAIMRRFQIQLTVNPSAPLRREPAATRDATADIGQ